MLRLQKGDYMAINRALVYFVFNISGQALAVPTIIVLWILKPFFWLKVGKLHHGRIGHLALETEVFLRKRQLGKFPDSPFYCFFCDSRGIANRQLLTMYKRVLRVYESRILVSIFDGMFPLFKNTPFYQPLGNQDTAYFEFNNANPSIYFTPDEIQKGRELLKKMNVNFYEDKYICIFARDKAFLNKTMGHQNWDYHDIRNADIDTFIEAIKYLIEKGLTVIRVGSTVGKPISYSHPRLVDYSVSKYRCDFLDIFLVGTCEFFVGSSSGIADIACLFDIPYLKVGENNFGLAPPGKNCLYIPKKFRFTKTDQPLHFEEAIALKLHPYARNLKELGLKVENNSPKDILEATREMLARVEGTFQYSPEEEKLMCAFQELWSQSDILGRNISTPIGIEWLQRNKELYF